MSQLSVRSVAMGLAAVALSVGAAFALNSASGTASAAGRGGPGQFPPGLQGGPRQFQGPTNGFTQRPTNRTTR